MALLFFEAVDLQKLYFIFSFSLKYLSLCQCDLNDEGVRLLGCELAYSENTTHRLLGLNLTHNQITCTGAQYLADVSMKQIFRSFTLHIVKYFEIKHLITLKNVAK